MLKECKTKECQNKLQQLKWKEEVKEEDQYKMERWGWRRLKNNRNKKQAGNCQRQSGMEEDYIGSQVPQQTVAPDERSSTWRSIMGKWANMRG